MLLTSIMIFVICLTVYCKRKIKHTAPSNKNVLYDEVSASSHMPPPLPQVQHSTHQTSSLEDLKQVAAEIEDNMSHSVTENIDYEPYDKNESSTCVDNDGNIVCKN